MCSFIDHIATYLHVSEAESVCGKIALFRVQQHSVNKSESAGRSRWRRLAESMWLSRHELYINSGIPSTFVLVYVCVFVSCREALCMIVCVCKCLSTGYR